MTARGPVTDWTATTLLAERAWLRALATRLVQDEAERDDLVQEACLAALRRPETDALDPRRWLGAVLRNRWRFGRRSDARRRERELARVEAHHAPSAGELAEQAELQRVLVGAVLALDEPYRSTVLLRYFGDLSSRAIARREGVPEGTVRSRLKRALDQLREELDRKNGGERRGWVMALVPLMRREPVLSAGVLAAAAGIAVLLLAGLWLRSAGTASTAAVSPVMAAADLVTEDAPEPTEGPNIGRESAPVAPSVVPAFAQAGLELLVLDPDGVPIPGASVTASGDVSFALVADANGSCRLRLDSWRSDYLPLRVEAPGFVHVDSTLERGGLSWSCPYPVYLPRAAELEGRLMDAETRAPIADAELLLVFCEHPLDHATTDGDGAFRLSPAPQGWEVQIEVRARDHAVQRRRIQVPSDAVVPLELVVEQGDELRGRVVDAVSGLPVAGARVFREENSFVGAPSEGAPELATSEASGSLVLRLADEDHPNDVLVTASGYTTVRLRPRVDGFEIPLVPSAWIEGTLREASGRLCANAAVMLDGGLAGQSEQRPGSQLLPALGSSAAGVEEARYFADPSRATTDENGRFRIAALPGIAETKLRVVGRGPGEHTVALPLQPGETRNIELTAPAALMGGANTILGVLRINGEPAPGRVQCRWNGGSTRVWSGPDGAFEILGVPDGTMELSAYPDEYERAAVRPSFEPMRVEVVAGTIAHAELDLELALGTIAGRVSKSSGGGRPHWAVLASARRAYWHGLTDADGRFELRVPVEAGTYRLTVQGAEPIQVPVGAQDVEIVSNDFGRLRLRVVDAATGALVERPTLFVRPLGKAWDWLGAYSADPSGLVEFVLASGRLDLAVSKVDDGYPPTLVSGFLLMEGSSAELAVQLARVAPVEFRLLDPPLPRPCGIRVEGTSADPTFALRGFGDGGPAMHLQFADGVAVVRGLPGGRYRLVASQEAIRLEPSEIEIGADGSRPIEIRWQRVETR